MDFLLFWLLLGAGLWLVSGRLFCVQLFLWTRAGH